MELNCQCDCEYESKTLLVLRTQLFQALGFVDPLTDPEQRTLGELRQDIMNRLGLAAVMTPAADTFGAIIGRVLDKIGMAAQLGSIPAPTRAMIGDFVNQAQQQLFRRLELDNGGVTPPDEMVNDSDPTTLDFQAVETLALAMAKGHIQQPDAKVYFDATERWLADSAARLPPNVKAQITRALQDAQRTVYRRYELGNTGQNALLPFTADDDVTTVDAQPVYLLALANMKFKANQPDGKAVYQEYETLMQDLLKRSPPNAQNVIKNYLKMAQEMLYRRYKVFRMERWFTWPLATGERFYGIGSNDERLAPDALAAPVMSNITIAGGGFHFNRILGYRVSAFNDIGETVPCDEKTGDATGGGATTASFTWAPVTGATGYKVYGNAPGGELLMATLDAATLAFSDDGSITPAGAMPTTNTTSIQCLKSLDPRAVSWVGVSDDETNWRQLRKGIPPEVYTGIQTGPPTHYEIRQCIEVWPSPYPNWFLRIKGFFGLSAFQDDADITSLDWQAIYLQALADCKAAYKMQDAQAAANQCREYVGQLVAGTHMTARYVPGRIVIPNAVRPIPAVPFT